MTIYKNTEELENYLNDQLEDPDFKGKLDNTRNQLEHDAALIGYGQDLTDDEQLKSINNLNQDLQAIFNDCGLGLIINWILDYYEPDSEDSALELAKLIQALNIDYLVTNKETHATYLNSPCYGYAVYLNDNNFWKKYTKQVNNPDHYLSGVLNYNQADHYVRITPDTNQVITFNGLKKFYQGKPLKDLFNNYLINNLKAFVTNSVKRQDVTKAELDLLVEVKFKLLAVLKLVTFKRENAYFADYFKEHLYGVVDKLSNYSPYVADEGDRIIQKLTDYYYPNHLDQLREILTFLRDEIPEQHDNKQLIYKNVFTDKNKIDFNKNKHSVGTTVNYKGYILYLDDDFNVNDPLIIIDDYLLVTSIKNLKEHYSSKEYVRKLIVYKFLPKFEKLLDNIRCDDTPAYKYSLTNFKYLKSVLD